MNEPKKTYTADDHLRGIYFSLKDIHKLLEKIIELASQPKF
jgi:hypothetical protein